MSARLVSWEAHKLLDLSCSRRPCIACDFNFVNQQVFWNVRTPINYWLYQAKLRQLVNARSTKKKAFRTLLSFADLSTVEGYETLMEQVRKL